MSRTTPMLPPTDQGMWRKLLARAHPDAGGGHELFVWTQALKEEICASARTHGQMGGFGRRPARASSRSAGARKAATDEVDRVPFDPSVGFDELTSRALHLAESGEVGEPYADLLRLLSEAQPSSSGQHRGASYKQLARIGHLRGMDKLGRRELYRIGEQIPLSEIHANYLLDTLMKGAA